MVLRCFGLCFFSLFAVQGDAALILRVDAPASIVAGNLLTVNITAQSDTINQQVSGFDLKFDIAPPNGVGLPDGFSFASPLITNPIFSSAPGTVTSFPPSGRDLYVNGDHGTGGAFATVQTNPTRLFSLNFLLADSMATQLITIGFAPGQGAFGVYDGVGGSIGLPTLAPASIQIQAVPEPASLLLVLGPVVAFATKRARGRCCLARSKNL